MYFSSKALLVFCLIVALVAETFAHDDEPIIVRSKRQQCRCVKNPNGGLTCSCAKGPASATATSFQPQFDAPPPSSEIANQLTAMQHQTPGHSQARCGCIQIVFQGAPQYNCQCADQNNGALLPTTTTTTTTSTTTTTTPSPPSTNTSYAPTITDSQANGACNCLMISISSPQTAQYQCQCNNNNNNNLQQDAAAQTFAPQTQIPGMLPTTVSSTRSSSSTSSPSLYDARGVVRSQQEACYCLDSVTNTMSPACGCRCNCVTLHVTAPNAYCGCPMAYDAYDNTQTYHTQPVQMIPTTTTTTTTTSTTAAPPTIVTNPALADATQYPLTTTCVMYVNVPTTACSCLPQYDQCAQNVCCLKSKFRSYKKTEETAPSTIDMLMNVLKTIKTKLE